MRGIQADIYDKASIAGGQMRTEIGEDRLPKAVLDREISVIEKLGVQFNMDTEIAKAEFEQLREKYDAVILASGLITDEQKTWGISIAAKGFDADNNNYLTNLPGVYAVGNTLRPSKLAIRSLAQGKEAAAAVSQMLNGKAVVGQPMKFNSKFGKLIIPEYAQYIKESVVGDRFEPGNGMLAGFTKNEVMAEAVRCLHCDCRKIDNCKLREYSDRYGAVQQRFYYNERKPVRKVFHETIVYEPEKCIKCGICVRLTEKYGEPFGFTYIGRGFDVEIGVPFNESINDGLKLIAEKVADACPTGALARK
jgi:ferredoxin